uniref:C1D nuclear receptor corepressor n=1 Tax=Ovis aries TaxID=9940 RepID=A0AC11CZM6_SHEEP
MERGSFSLALFHFSTSVVDTLEGRWRGDECLWHQAGSEEQWLIVMAGEGINEDYPVEIHEYLSTFENSIGAVDEMLKTMMSVSRNELLQKLDPLEQAKVDLVSAYTLNSMFWVYLATQGVNPKEHPVKQELERIRVYMNRVKEITDKKKAGKLDRGAASRFVKNALWEPKPKNAPKVANKGKSKN